MSILIFISLNLKNIQERIRYVDDTRKGISISSPAIDCPALQDDLEAIYLWARDANMVFNADKFEALRFWPGKIPKPDVVYTALGGQPIEEKVHLRDLGVEISNDLSFSIHIENTVASASKLIGWAMRSFRRKSRYLMMTIWKSLTGDPLED